MWCEEVPREVKLCISQEFSGGLARDARPDKENTLSHHDNEQRECEEREVSELEL